MKRADLACACIGLVNFACVGGVACSRIGIGAFYSTVETPLVTPRSRSPVRASLPRSRTSCPFAPSLRSCSAAATRTARSYLANTVRHATAPHSRLSAGRASNVNRFGRLAAYCKPRPTFRKVLRHPWLRQFHCGHPCPVPLGSDSVCVGESFGVQTLLLRFIDDSLQMSPSLTGTAPVLWSC